MISALFTDKYQISMAYAHWKNQTHEQYRSFDLYFRSLPFGNGYAVFAGLEKVIHYLINLKFTEEDIHYLQSSNPQFEPSFFDYLRQFRFKGMVYAVPEGSIVFPNQPLLRLEGRIVELQLIETALLNFIGFQTLIATKAARIKQIASNDTLMDFGTRRAQEMDAAIWGARSAYIAGFDSTSNMKAGQMFDIPTSGTHSHAWIQNFDHEQDAFQKFSQAFGDQSVLLVDTYDTLRSGLPHAIQVGLHLRKQGKKLLGIRIDSGDLAYLSKQARKMLDEAGLMETQIIASSDLDESTIINLKAQGAKIDGWGIGTRLITAYNQPALGTVYKMVAKYEKGIWKPTMKISSNPSKITTPGRKMTYRILDQDSNKAQADLITLADEQIDDSLPLTLFHPIQTYKQKVIRNYRAIPLLKLIFKQGRLVYPLPSLIQIRQFHQAELNCFWEEYLRIFNPEEYPVDLSEKLWQLKNGLIQTLHSQVKT